MAPPNVPNLSPIDEDVSIETQEEQRLDQQIDKHIRHFDTFVAPAHTFTALLQSTAKSNLTKRASSLVML